eukprot:4814933-Amphidinium_carterae.1
MTARLLAGIDALRLPTFCANSAKKSDLPLTSCSRPGKGLLALTILPDCKELWNNRCLSSVSGPVC